jgi:hypothetical protein
MSPVHDMGELLSQSMRRGRQLRRRRHAWVIAPAAGLALGASAVWGHAGAAQGQDRIQMVTQRPTPATSVSEAPVPSLLPRNADLPTLSVRGPFGSRSAGPVPQLSVAPVAPVASRAWAHLSQTLDDPRGDATPAGAPVGSVANDSALDIVRVRLTSDDSGLAFVMDLAAPFRGDGYYWLELTDASSGCTLRVYLGAGWADAADRICSSGSTRLDIPQTADPSYVELKARVPYRSLTAGLSPSHAFRVVTAATGTSPPGAAGSTRTDVASSDRPWGPFR